MPELLSIYRSAKYVKVKIFDEASLPYSACSNILTLIPLYTAELYFSLSNIFKNSAL